MKSCIPSILITLLVFLPFVVNAQQREAISLEKIAPSSPEIAQLGKYGNIPVNHATGAISVEIPVFTINTPRFKWPLAFTYHGSGIRVDEIATSAGSGWSFTGIGAVNRTIMGVVDESSMMTENYPTKTSQIGGLSQQAWLDLVSILAEGVAEPDQFSFNFLDKSGSFQLDRQKGVLVQSEQNLQVAFSSGGSVTITDEQGNSYVFGTYESTVSKMHGPNGEPIVGGEAIDGITGWFLTKALSHDRSDSILFEYGSNYEVVQELDQYSFKVGEDMTFQNTCVLGRQYPQVAKTGIQRTRTLAQELKAIIFRNGKVVLNYVRDRKDMGWGWGNMGRLASIDIYRNNNGVYEFFQQTRLHHSYFISPDRPPLRDTSLAYRLRLDSVTVVNATGQNISRGFQLSYNTTPMPYRTSPAQDYWGYATVKVATDNTLVPRRMFMFENQVYDLGGANRNSDSLQMQAGSLQRITYPTCGYTEFTYEPHKFWDTQLLSSIHPPNSTNNPIEERATAVPPSPTNIARKYFKQTAASQTATFNAFFTAYHGKSDAPPYAKIKQVAGSGFINELTLASPDAYTDQTVSASYTLLNGYTYLIETYVHGGSYPINEVSASGWLYRDSVVTTPGGETHTGGYRTVGGLRIKQITNYTAGGIAATKENYSYGEAGEGLLVGNLNIFHRHYRNVIASVTGIPEPLNPLDPNNKCKTCRYSYRLYTDQAPYALSTISGSIVAYNKVRKSLVNNTGKSIGTQMFEYDIITDDYDIIPGMDNFISLAKPWHNGKLLFETTFGATESGSTYKLQSREYQYSNIRLDTAYHIGVAKKFSAYCGQPILDYFSVYQGRKYYGNRLPSMVVTTTWASGPENQALTMKDTVRYQYGANNAHRFPIVTTRRQSNGSSFKQLDYYPEDMIRDLGDNGSGIFPQMIQKGLTGQLVLTREQIDGIQIAETKTEYYSPFSTFIKPYRYYRKLGTSPTELYKEQSYYSNGNLLEHALSNNIKVSYVWGYGGQFPIAEATNAPAKSIFFTSFEDGEGNATNGDAKAGSQSRVGGYVKNLTDLSSGAYTLRYWKKQASAWVLFEEDITVAGNTYQINLSGQVDDIRFHPKAAQMSTYTFDPLLGVTSQCDVSGRFTYYEYDAFGRLSIIRGNDKNIQKKISYNYAGQPEM